MKQKLLILLSLFAFVGGAKAESIPVTISGGSYTNGSTNIVSLESGNASTESITLTLSGTTVTGNYTISVPSDYRIKSYSAYFKRITTNATFRVTLAGGSRITINNNTSTQAKSGSLNANESSFTIEQRTNRVNNAQIQMTGLTVTFEHVNHTYSNGSCTVCGSAHSGHTYNDVPGVCDVCGKAHEDHKYDNEPGVCDVCGKAHADHKYDNVHGVCDVCGKAHTNHTYEGGSCSVCHSERTQNWSGWTAETAKSGSWYLYNLGSQKFITVNSNGAPAATEVSSAIQFTISGLENTDLAYKVGEDETTYYLYQDAGSYGAWVAKQDAPAQERNTTPMIGMTSNQGTVVGDNQTPAWYIKSYESGGYQIHSNHNYRDVNLLITRTWNHVTEDDRYITYKDPTTYNCSRNNSEYNTDNGAFLFISEDQMTAYKNYIAAWNAAHALESSEHYANLTDDMKKDLSAALSATTNYSTAVANTKALIDAISIVIDVKQASGGWATLYLPYTTQAPEDVELYAATYNSDRSTVTLIPVNLEDKVVPAKTGLIVKASVKRHTFTYAAGTEATIESNDLSGVLEDTDLSTVDGTCYLLSKPAGYEIGFYEWSGNKNLGANKAYLCLHNSSVKECISLNFGGEDVDAIVSVQSENDAPIFDVQGRKLTSIPAHGMYIKNGKKYIVK